jgi:hypothetical protein
MILAVRIQRRPKQQTKGNNKTQVIFTCLESTDESKQRKRIDK